MDLGSPSPRGAIIRSSLIKLREMSKDSAMLARRTMRTQIITSLHRRRVFLSFSMCMCVCVYTCVPFPSIFLSIQCVCVRAFVVSDIKYLHFLTDITVNVILQFVNWNLINNLLFNFYFFYRFNPFK